MFDLTTYIWATKTATAIAETATGSKTVDINTSTGQLDEEALETLKQSKGNMIVAVGKVYRLSRVEQNSYKYINTRTDGASDLVKMTELDLNITTGEFTIRDISVEGQSVEELEEKVDNHIADTTAHITAEEREFWNNKVTAEATQIGLTTDFTLSLSKQ